MTLRNHVISYQTFVYFLPHIKGGLGLGEQFVHLVHHPLSIMYPSIIVKEREKEKKREKKRLEGGWGIPEFGPDLGTGKGDLGRERGIVGEIQT